MKRRIINIDKEKCNGCTRCVSACHEGAIGMVDGKAVLLRDDYCDGLGDCLPVCPTGAITFTEREAAEYLPDLPCGCPGNRCEVLERKPVERKEKMVQDAGCSGNRSQLRQWPVQIRLVPENAGYFENADLLIAADCAAYAHGNFHADFMKNKITLIGCPKLDNADYSEKLTGIIANNNINSITVVRMEVPCCGGLEHATETALKNSGNKIPWQVVTITTEGETVRG